VAKEASRNGYSCLGITGTKWLVDSDVYPEKLCAHGLGFERPDPADRLKANRIIMDELVYGRFEKRSVEAFQQIIGHLKEKGCDAVVLGCTEIPLIIGDDNSPLPTLDSTRLLACAALSRALSDVG
jgi:aspartate racemase